MVATQTDQHSQNRHSLSKEEVVKRLYQIVENGQPLDQRHWPDQLVTLTESLTSLSAQNLEPGSQAQMDEQIQAVQQENQHDATKEQLSPLIENYLYSKLPPSLRLYARNYVEADEGVRERTKNLAFHEVEETPRKYTVAEVQEMLKLFMILDRLAYLDKVIAEERRRQNAKYHIDPGKAEELRRNMVRFSQRIIDEQSRHQQIRNRLLSVMGRDTAGQARTHPSQEIDYVKLRKMLTEKYEAAVQEMNEKKLWSRPEPSGKMRKFITTEGMGSTLRNLGVKVKNNHIVQRLKEIANSTKRSVLASLAREDHLLLVRNEKTGEVIPPLNQRPSERFGEEVVRFMERVM